MSRWRETLCGSSIKPTEEYSNHMEAIVGEVSELLSCGGFFKPQKTFHKIIPATNKLIHLPTEDYTVLVNRTGENQPKKYHQSRNDFGFDEEKESIENALSELELKSIK